MLYTGSTLTNTQAHAMHSRVGKAGGINTLRKRTGTKSPARPLQGTAFWPIPNAPEATMVRNYQRLVGTTWKYTLTAAQQAAWDTLAGTVSPLKDNGQPIAAGGRALFMWYCMTNIFTGWYPSFVLPSFDPTAAANPPALWNPPPDPGAPASFNLYNDHDGQIYFSSIYTNPTNACCCLFPSNRAHHGTYLGTPNQRVLCAQLTFGPPSFTLVVNWWTNGFFPDNWKQNGRPIIIRLLSDPPNSVPSDPFRFQLP